MSITGGTTITYLLEQFIYAPVRHPELLPSLLPIIFGAFVIELYFGKYKHESLGWNTSVGNAVIWLTTGVTLLMSSGLETLEKQAAYFLIGVGAFVGYMDFTHKWPESVAFVVSSSGIVYTLAYIIVVVVKTDLPITNTTLKASAVFFLAVNIMFRIIQSFEATRDQPQQFGFQ
ncbi:MAG: hypothetical protein ABEJ69_01925 [Candidatus Nanohaloarchaea archaeon]